MKIKPLNTAFLLFSLFVVGCAGIGVDNEPPKVNTELSYKDLLGTYVFRPNTSQAKKLGIIAGDTVILNITDKQIKGFKSDSATSYGEYNINKMILVFNKDANRPYVGTWMFFYSKDNVPGRNMNSNLISFYKKDAKSYDFKFDIERDDHGVLHLAAFVSDPKYEFIKLIDFRKVK